MTAASDVNLLQSVSSNASAPHTFYNSAPELGIARRNESKILYMRNFNNWTKSILINEYIERIRKDQPRRGDQIHVFDMGCGKGGDIPKWQKGDVKSVTFADLAEKSVDACKQRCNEKRSSFEAEFFPLDCTKELLRTKLEKNEPCFDLVSTQFVIHYSFENIQSVNRFLRNASEFLRVGGYFIGTTMNSCELVKRCRNSPDQTISNDVFRIHFDSSINLNEKIPLFGAKYHFILDEVVDCPEYLVYFPLLEKLAEKHGLKLIEHKTFYRYFENNSRSRLGRKLLDVMKPLQRYEIPKDDSNDGKGSPIDHSQFTHVKNHFEEISVDNPNSSRCWRTLSKQEWEITNFYIIFAFQKVRHVEYNENDEIIDS